MSGAKEILSQSGFRFAHRLGQNFIFDESLLARLTELAGVCASDSVLEIGPGAGTLTQALAERAKRVLALEIDQALLPVLAKTLAQCANVRVVQGDALKADLKALCAQYLESPIKAVANLPYYITTDLVLRLLSHGGLFAGIAVMVQREVGEKMMARPGEDGYGPLAIACQYHARVSRLCAVPAACFTPKPKVDSSFMQLALYGEKPIQVPDETLFFRVVQAGFAMRRKTLVNNLQAAFAMTRETAWTTVERAGLASGVRGETLSIQDYARLSFELASTVC